MSTIDEGTRRTFAAPANRELAYDVLRRLVASIRRDRIAGRDVTSLEKTVADLHAVVGRSFAEVAE